MTENGSALVTRAEDVPTASAFGDREAFGTAQRIATALAASTVVPEVYRGNMPNVLVAMEYAHRLGASVLAVMQNLHIIQGKPSLSSQFLIGTVNAGGRFTPIRWKWQGTEGKDDWGCRAWATDRESGEECVGPLVTIATAKAENWFQKTGSKWKTIPELMLMYRSAGWWTRLFAPELSLGLQTTDEAEDLGPAPLAASTLNERLNPAPELVTANDTPPETGIVGELPLQ